jgi:hypothetical protein
MRILETTVFISALLVAATVAWADIIPTAPSAEGLNGAGTSWDASRLEFAFRGSQSRQPGRLTVNFISDTDLDPTLTLQNIIGNDTDFAWTGYRVKVSMDQDFTLSSPMVNYGETSELGWSGAVTVSPAVWNGSAYMGQVDYWGGTPIPVGGTLDFSYDLTFVGTAHYCQEMTPLPEPSSLVLLGSGAIGLLCCKWRRRRANRR